MQALVRRWWQEAQAAPTGVSVYRVALAAALALGLFLRLNGYLGQHISLWLDEALWAPRFVNWPLLSLGIRPIGFVWLTRLLVSAFGATEFWFRFLPNMAALAALCLTPYVASRLFESRPVRVLFVLLFAIHPALVDFANEFKPYSFEVLVHLVPIALYLRFEQNGRRGYLLALFGYLPLSFLFAYNMAFAFPGLLLLGLREAFRADAERKKLVAATLLSGALCVGVAGGVYKLALTNVTSEKRTESYWGKKYDVFYRASQEESRVDWTLGKYGDFAALIGQRRNLWQPYGNLNARAATELGSVDRWLWITLSVAGLVALARHRRQHLLLLVAPVLVLALVNALGKWPFGAFRTNMFMSVYLFPVPLLGLEWLARASVLRERALLLAVSMTCLLPGFLFGFDWHGHKRTWTRDHYGREVIERLYELRREQLRERPDAPRARLVLDLHTYETQRYYLQTHPSFSAKYGAFFKANFAVDEVGSSSLVSKVQQRLRGGEPVWAVASKDSSTDAIGEFARSRARILKEARIFDEHLILLVGKN
jgi:hypothetical protein